MTSDSVPEAPELLIVGGGIAGCMTAVHAFERGVSVAVVEKRAYLGREISAYNHTFVGCADNDDALRRCPGPFRGLFCAHGGGELVVPEGMVRQDLMRILGDRGIPVLFEAEPVGVSLANGGATGLLLACPIGLAWLPGQAIVDGTERRNLHRLLTGWPYLEQGQALVHAAFEMAMSSSCTVSLLAGTQADDLNAAEDAMGLVLGSLRLHATMRNDVLLVEYAFQGNSTGALHEARSQLETEGRRRSVALASWLRENVPDFKQASLFHLGYECHIGQEGEGDLDSGSDCANVSALPVLPWGFSLEDVADQSASIRTLVNGCVPRSVEAPLASGFLVGGRLRIPMASLPLSPYDDDALRVPLFTVSATDGLNPGTVFSSDVCVAGVGAGGGMAMLAAAERGCRVTAIEVNRELGGTHTVGRVVGYYAGYRDGANTAAEEEARSTAPSALTNSSPGGPRHARFLLEKASELGVRLLTGTRACGVRLEDGTVRQVLAANEDGIFAIEAKTTIDATGDADVAAFAGAHYRIGDDRDGMIQSYSMWGSEVYPTPSFLAQRYLTDPGIFHPDLYSERLRAISIAHRDNSPNHISPMLTPRESRRVEGEHSLSLDDILGQRVFSDVVAVACTQADSHAFTSSPAAKLGSIGSGIHFRVRIPFGCFIPKDMEGLLIAAKAISGERDATSFCRMNADIKNAGYAIGAAAAMAVKAGVRVRDIDLAALQGELSRLDVLPAWAFQAEPRESVTDCLAKLQQTRLAGLDRLLHFLPPEETIPELERCYALSPKTDTECADSFLSEKSLQCMALAWHGSVAASERLVSLFRRAVTEGRHMTPPHLKSFRMNVGWGALGEDDYSLINRLLVLVGRSQANGLLAPLVELIEDTPGLGGIIPLSMPYDRNRGDIITQPFYHRLRNVAYAVERNANSALSVAMEHLLRREGIAGHATPMASHDSPHYMLAHLEVCLARAAARCGCRLGAEILIRYLTDTHVFFRRHAREELTTVAGGDQGSVEEWRTWLDNTPAWNAVPVNVRTAVQ